LMLCLTVHTDDGDVSLESSQYEWLQYWCYV